MNSFELDCPFAAEPVEITFSAESQARGKTAFRGFSCSNEALCHAAGVKCALYDLEGFEPFDVSQALRHLNG